MTAVVPIRTERVAFPSSRETLIGTLHLPSGSRGPVPGVVVSGAWRTVKEQMAGRYARELAQRGFAALAFDFRSWGESGGAPRSMEDPSAKADDIVAAAEFLTTRPEVEPHAVAALGVCAGGAYTATAATRSATITTIALVAPALPSRATVLSELGGRAGVDALTALAERAARQYAESGRETLVPAVDPAPGSAAPDYYTDPRRGAVPQWDNTVNPASWTSWLTYDAQAAAPDLTQPLLVVHSDAAAAPQSVREFVALVPRPVRELWLDDVTQFDFYDDDVAVATAVDAVADHLARTARTGAGA